MNKTLEGIHSRITETEVWINDLEDRMVEITATEPNIEKRMKRNEDSLRDPWDSIKGMNVCTVGVPEGEEREKGPEKIFEEIITENIPNMGKEIIKPVEAVQSPRQDKPKEEHTAAQSNQTERKTKDRDKISKVTRDK